MRLHYKKSKNTHTHTHTTHSRTSCGCFLLFFPRPFRKTLPIRNFAHSLIWIFHVLFYFSVGFVCRILALRRRGIRRHVAFCPRKDLYFSPYNSSGNRFDWPIKKPRNFDNGLRHHIRRNKTGIPRGPLQEIFAKVSRTLSMKTTRRLRY